MQSRRQWLRAAAACLASPAVLAARKEFWDAKAPANWSDDEKQTLLWKSPWARDGFARMDDKKPQTAGYGNNGRQGIEVPDSRPGVPAGGAKSVPIGEPVPPRPEVPGQPIQFHVSARWETAKPVRLAGGPEAPELTGQFYVIRLRGLPLMPPPKPKPGEPSPPDPNQALLQAINAGSRLERPGKPAIPCAHLFTRSENSAIEVLLYFPRTPDPISLTDKIVTLESRFSVFHLSIKFPLKEMIYKGELAL